MKNAVILRRVSTTMQSQEGYSLQNQQEVLKQYCERKGLNIIKDAELVESSTRGERKHFMEILTFCKKQRGGVALVCLKTDRLMRNFKNYTMIDEMRKEGQLELHLVQENLVLDKNSKAGDLTILGLNVVMAQNYVLSLRDNVVSGMKHQAEHGFCMYRAPLGYLNIRKPDGKADVIVDTERAPIVQQLFEKYSTGLYSLKDMEKQCKQWGLTSKYNGKPLNTSAIHRILNNKFYIGEMLYKDSFFKHQYETLISPALFQMCQDIMHGRKPEEQKTHFKSTEEPFLFRGLVRCGVCGCIMSSYKKVKPNGNEYIYLKCSHFKDCDNPQLSEVKALKPIEEELTRLFVREEIFSYIKKDLERIVNKQNEVHNREVKMVRRQYDNCQDKIKRLRSLLLEGHLTPEEYRDMNEELKKEQYELEGKSTSLTQADENFSIAITTIMSLAKNAYQIFKSSRVETQRAILNILLSNLQIKDKQISYNLRKPFDLITSLNEKTPPKIEGVAIGEQESTKIGPKSVININFFVEHRSEILAMKEQVQMIRSFIHA